MTETSELTEALRNVDLFAGVSDDHRAALAGQMRTFAYQPGDVVIEQEHEGAMGRMYVILDGEAEATVGGTSVAQLGPGDHFGEMSLLDNEPRSATIRAVTPLRVAGLASWNLRSIIVEQPEVALNIIEVLARRLRAANRQLG